MTALRVPVAPAVLEWAQERAGQSNGGAAVKFKSWPKWISGSLQPTLRQVEQIATWAHVPFGALFLPEPLPVELPVADFRVGPGGPAHRPSQELLDSLQTSQRRQNWFHDYATRVGLEPVALVGSARDQTPEQAAQWARATLGFEVSQRQKLTRDDVRNLVRDRFENLGGIAIFAGIVGNNTHRPLDNEEFRGFSLSDDYAPLIFVNAKDSKGAQLFTFFHELGHILRRESGVSEWSLTDAPPNDAERWCNAFAAEVLVPAADLRAHTSSGEITTETLDALSKRYNASTLTILVRMRSLALIPRNGFDDRYQAERDRIMRIVDEAPARSGGNHWNNQKFRISARFARAIIADTYEGGTSYTDALRLLGFSSATMLDTYAEKLGV
ncbi:MAG: ImmA/IrrE family metallo-endopeptidase [Cellulomonadaceae bacterium]|jgi:Zn-dependent peptidase ImmA (M78 family)|nr:ImmA/IrrE family metallo-endopeptidase [Cellulomonadaceae bacterium]